MESPEYVRTSTAAAIIMGLKTGSFYRMGNLHCVNILLTYKEGCYANCGYCGLNKARKGSSCYEEKSFIRVDWPLYKLDKVIEKLNSPICDHIDVVCLSMVVHPKAVEDMINVISELHERTDKRLSALITPTLADEEWLKKIKEAGANHIGLGMDGVTEEIFDNFKGEGVNGPHRWDKYWEIVDSSLKFFGSYKVGVHLIVGLGETEKQMCEMIQKCSNKDMFVHLFSFFPERGSKEDKRQQPPIGQYRRIQLARYLITEKVVHEEKFTYNEKDQILDFGMDTSEYIELGKAFMTAGCKCKNGKTACTRPSGNSTAYQALNGEMRNFTILPEKEDIQIIKKQIKDYSLEGTYPHQRYCKSKRVTSKC